VITLIARGVLGVVTIALIIASNRQIFRRVPNGPQLSQMECAYYVIDGSDVTETLALVRSSHERLCGTSAHGIGPEGLTSYW
jgi:hypothetical protein